MPAEAIVLGVIILFFLVRSAANRFFHKFEREQERRATDAIHRYYEMSREHLILIADPNRSPEELAKFVPLFDYVDKQCRIKAGDVYSLAEELELVIQIRRTAQA